MLFLDTEVSKAALITGSSGNRVANDLLKIQAPGLKAIWPSFLGCPECLRAAISQITRPANFWHSYPVGQVLTGSL